MIVRASDGASLAPEALFAELRQARLVFIGEQHDRAADHEVQRAIVEALSHVPAMELGMEMFQQPFQAPLDAWSAGTIDEAQLLTQTEWDTRWRVDFALYRPILLVAREMHLPVIALNAPRELTRAIARGGLEGLSESERAGLPEMDTTDAEHRAFVMSLLGEHPGHGDSGMDPAMLERMYLAQLCWDETMGDRVARAFAQTDVASTPVRMIVLAGRAHVERGLGIPRRAERRGTPHGVIVLPITAEELEPLRAASPAAADYYWIID